MVHVALVQGDCEPPGATTNVTAHLSPTTSAWIPSIDGPLACAGTPAPASLSFDDPGTHGEVEIGSFADVAYTASNSGQLEATNVVFSGLTGDWSQTGGSCGATIAGGADCTIVVRFTPTSAGVSADTLLLDYEDGVGPAATVEKGVSGNGTQPSVPAVEGAAMWLLVASLLAGGIYRLRCLRSGPGGT
jgi:hypothetical protein